MKEIRILSLLLQIPDWITNYMLVNNEMTYYIMYIISLRNLIMIDCRMMYDIMKKTMNTHSKHEFICFYFTIRSSVRCFFQFHFLLLVFSMFYISCCYSNNFSRNDLWNFLVSSNSYQQCWAINFNSICFVVPCSLFSFSFLLFPFFTYQLK